MRRTLKKMQAGYARFRDQYVNSQDAVMAHLAKEGQHPKIMVVACSDSRVDPGVIFGTDPGDLFIVRNVANLIPPYEKDNAHHGTSAALEFGVCYLNVEQLVILGHSHCGGIAALHNPDSVKDQNDFISKWVSIVDPNKGGQDPIHSALRQSKQNAMSFPWIRERVERGELGVQMWCFDIEKGEIMALHDDTDELTPLEEVSF